MLEAQMGDESRQKVSRKGSRDKSVFFFFNQESRRDANGTCNANICPNMHHSGGEDVILSDSEMTVSSVQGT